MRRTSAFADGIDSTVRSYRRAFVVPVVDLTRRHRRYEEPFVAATRRVLASGTVLLGAETAALEAELPAALHGATATQRARRRGRQRRQRAAAGARRARRRSRRRGDRAGVHGRADGVRGLRGRRPPGAGRRRRAHRRARPGRRRGRRHDGDRGDHHRPPLRAAGGRRAAARARHARRRGRRPGARCARTGSPASAAVYSFYPTKNVGGIGDGGAVVTTDAELATTIRRLRVHGMTEQYVHTEISQNHRMSELEAAWLRLQLPDLAADNRRRATIARRYRAAAPELCWQADHPDHVVHQCVLRAADRDATRGALAARGVATGVHYPLAITQQPAYRAPRRAGLPARRGVGGDVRLAAVLPRAVRRRGRHRRRPPWSTSTSDAPEPRGPGDLGLLPLLQRRARDPDDGPRRPPGARRGRRRLRDHRRRRRLVRRLGRRPARARRGGPRAARRGAPDRTAATAAPCAAGSRRRRGSGSSTPTATPSTTPPRSCAASTRSRPGIDIVQGFKLGRGDSWYRIVIGRAYHHTVRAAVPAARPGHRLRLPPDPARPARQGRADVDVGRDLRRDDAPLPGRRGHVRRGRRQPPRPAPRAVAVLPAAGHRPLGASARRAVVDPRRPR